MKGVLSEEKLKLLDSSFLPGSQSTGRLLYKKMRTLREHPVNRGTKDSRP